MNSDQLEGKWKQMKGAVREKWGKLPTMISTSLEARKMPWSAEFRNGTELQKKRPNVSQKSGIKRNLNHSALR